MSLVYQTLQFPCDREYNAEPLNYTGIRTIKLTNKPANVEVWISTDNTGQNLFPLKNRGDGWVNLDEPLQNCYIYTNGLNNTSEMLILNVTGQKDIFEYGTSSVERIGNVQELYMLQNLSPNAIAQIAKAIQGVYYKPPIHTIKIQGEISKVGINRKLVRVVVFPMGFKQKISTLNLSNEKFYKIEIIGHCDVGGTDEDLTASSGYNTRACNIHLCLFNDTNQTDYTELISPDVKNAYYANTRPWKSEIDDIFDIYGLKFYRDRWGGNPSFLETGGLNIFPKDTILAGKVINQYDYLAYIFNNIEEMTEASFVSVTGTHFSLILNIYEMETYDQLIGANK